MIYVCNNCGNIIPELNTPGDEFNKNFICPKCAEEVHKLLIDQRDALTDYLNPTKPIP